MKVLTLPYSANSSDLLAILHDASGLIWFHEGQTQPSTEWMSAWPTETFEYHGNGKIIQIDHDQTCHELNDNWFDFLKRKNPTFPATKGFSFTGGLAGHLSYDLGLELLNIPTQHINNQQPLGVVGLYHWAIQIDHSSKKRWLIIQDSCLAKIVDKLASLTAQLNDTAETQAPQPIDANWQTPTDKESYQQSFQAIKRYIEEGDAYQVNLTRQWRLTEKNLDDLTLYNHLSKLMPAPFSVFHRNRSHSLLSVSPERFIKIQDQQVLTQPIKGTIARGKTDAEDLANAQKLSNSAKDKAENLMIVDLLRNDIAKNAQANSVKVEKLFEVQSFNYVHHLVSTITAKLKPMTHPLDALRDAFPGGSITGAPKKRAMEIIDELETVNRGTYCGSAFYLNADGDLDSNILIRTVNLNACGLSASAGGGIVFDSELTAEFDESEIKIAKILAAIKPVPKA